MDFQLKCNNLECRAIITHKAIITTCSHIFCITCQSLFIKKSCPACESPLDQPDDASIRILDPSEDYKSSILSGLKPEVVMDIASRAISFYYYQTCQEQQLNQLVLKNEQVRSQELQSQLDTLQIDAARELESLDSKLTVISRELEDERNQGHQAQEKLQVQTRQYQKLRGLFDQLKRKMGVEGPRQPLALMPLAQSQNSQPSRSFLSILKPSGSRTSFGNASDGQQTPLKKNRYPFLQPKTREKGWLRGGLGQKPAGIKASSGPASDQFDTWLELAASSTSGDFQVEDGPLYTLNALAQSKSTVVEQTNRKRTPDAHLLSNDQQEPNPNQIETYNKRQKNTEAARRSRDKKVRRVEALLVEISSLRTQNIDLQVSLAMHQVESKMSIQREEALSTRILLLEKQLLDKYRT